VKTEEIYVFRTRCTTSNSSSNIIGHFVPSYDRCCPTGRTFDEEDLRGLAAPDHTVPYGTDLSGHSSQALRARLRSVVPTGRKCILRAEALIKLALMGLKPLAESSSPFGANSLT
jgi:hypothetical protein